MHTHTSASAPASRSFAADGEAILARARELAHAMEAGSMPPSLRGMNLGLICESEDSEEARLFESAATALGGRVTPIAAHSSEIGAAGDDSLRQTARVLGRLYDGLECQGLAPGLVQQLRRTAGVPVFDGLASPDHPTAALAERLAVCAALTQAKRLLILQGALLFALLNYSPTSRSAPPQQAP